MDEDIVIEMATEKLDNSKEVRVTRFKNRVEHHPEQDGVAAWDEVVVDKIEDAVLYPYMYDATRFFYKDNDGTNLSLSDAVSHFEFSLGESVGEHKSFEMNMSTRLDEEGVDHWDEKVYYSDTFTYNPDTGFYSLVIYTPAKSVDSQNNQIGFNDSVISIEENMSAPPESAFLRVSVEYRTNLPPCLIQGIPKKFVPSEVDPVFPDDASRVDIGVNQIPDYFQNSQGYTQDYLFTNSAPMYVADASGFLPEEISNDYTFSGVSAYLEDSDTTMKMPVDFEVLSDEHIKEKSLDVTVEGTSASYSAQLEMVIWRTKIKNSTNSTNKNILTIEAAVEPTTDEV